MPPLNLGAETLIPYPCLPDNFLIACGVSFMSNPNPDSIHSSNNLLERTNQATSLHS